MDHIGTYIIIAIALFFLYGWVRTHGNLKASRKEVSSALDMVHVALDRLLHHDPSTSVWQVPASAPAPAPPAAPGPNTNPGGAPHQPNDPPSADPYQPDGKARIRLPKVEALRPELADVWWLCPWVVPLVGGDTLRAWYIRGNAYVNADGSLGTCSDPQFSDFVLGGPQKPYSIGVPYEYAPGKDEAGRDQVAIRQSAHITDKLTRAIRANSEDEFVAYLQAHPDLKILPTATTGPGNGDQFSG